MKRALIFTILTLAVAGSASAEKFYKWKDSNGVWQYTTTPPPAGAESSTVSVQGGGASTNDSPAVEPNQPESPAQAAQADQAATSDMTAEIRQKRAELCANAKKRVEVLRSNAVVEMEGKRLTPEEQSTELSKAQSAVNVYCAPG